MEKFCQFLTELSARDTSVNINGFSSNLVCALILRSGLELLMDKFCQFLTELSARDMPVFSFPESKC